MKFCHLKGSHYIYHKNNQILKATFLGTGTSQGVPVITCSCNVCRSNDLKDKRLRSSLLLDVNGKIIVIDAGPDFRQQMIREQIKQVDAVLITHGHKDHIGGLDDIRAYNYVSRKPMDVYASAEASENIRRDFYYVFERQQYPGIPKINLIEIQNKPFMVQGIKIIPVEIDHMYLKIFGFRIGALTYITDCNHIPPDEMEKIAGSKVLIINALRMKSHVSHFSLPEALDIIEMIKPEKAYITHISHQLGMHEEVSAKLPNGVFLGYDGLEIEV